MERDIERQTHTHRDREGKRRERERGEKNAGVAGTWCHYTEHKEFSEHSFQFVPQVCKCEFSNHCTALKKGIIKNTTLKNILLRWYQT